MTRPAADVAATAAADAARRIAAAIITQRAYVSIRQHTSAHVSIRQHTSAYGSIRQHTPAYVSIRQHTSAYVSIRQHTTAYGIGKRTREGQTGTPTGATAAIRGS
jgi:hypothetical protein